MQSKLGHSIHNLFLTHEGGVKSLAVLFSGGDGSTDAPTLHYARKAALLAGCDVLSIEYSNKIGFDLEVLNAVTEESYQAVTQGKNNRCLRQLYS